MSSFVFIISEMNHKRMATFFFVSLAILLSSCSEAVHANSPTENVSAKPVSLYQGTDLHFLSPSLTDHGFFFQNLIKNADGKASYYGPEVVDAFLSDVKKDKPDVLVLSGDLTFNGEKQSHLDLVDKLTALQKDGIQPLVIPGNHDIANSDAAKFTGDTYELVSSVTKEEFRKLYWSFGPEKAFSVDEDSFSYVYHLRKDLWLLFLDADSNGTNKISDETFEWATEALKEAKKNNAQVISVSHETLLAQNPLFSSRYNVNRSADLAPIYEDNGVFLNLSGHMHIQHQATEKTLTDATLSSLLVTPNQYAEIHYDGHALTYATKEVPVKEWAIEKGLTDQNLLDFHTYSRKFFHDSDAANVNFMLANDYYSTSDHDAMVETFCTLNANYFGGIPTDLAPLEQGINLWLASEYRYRNYIQKITQDCSTDYRHFSLSR